MSKKPSTITKKPTVDASLESWISGANQNEPPPVIEREQAGQPASQPAESGEATAMLSVRIPGSLHKALRVHAVSQSLQIQDIVSQLIRDYLAEEQKAP